MAIALVTHTIAKSAAGNGFTTSGIDTTGATLGVLVVADQFGTIGTVSDSKGNTWTALTTYDQGSGTIRVTAYYSVLASVGSGHTATYTGNLTFGAMSFSSWSGTHATTPFDAEAGNTNAASSFDTSVGSVTPAGNNELLITAAGWISNNPNGGNMTVTAGGSYTALDNIDRDGNASGLAVAYLIQTTVTASNVTWHNGGAGFANTAVTTNAWKAAGGGGGGSAAPVAFVHSFARSRASTY